MRLSPAPSVTYGTEPPPRETVSPWTDSFSALFERETARDPRALRYEGTHDVHINTLWNQEGVMKSSCGAFYAFEPRTRLAVTVESPYYGLAGNVVTAEALVEEGRCLYRALRAFQREHGEA